MKFIYYNSNSDFSKEDLYDNIIKASLENDDDLLIKTLDFARYSNVDLDLSYQNGLFPALAAQNGNLKILKILYEHDSKLISEYGVETLIHAARYGKVDCVSYLLNQNVSPLELKNTTAYNNYHEVEEVFITYEKEHQNTVEITGNNITFDTHIESNY